MSDLKQLIVRVGADTTEHDRALDGLAAKEARAVEAAGKAREQTSKRISAAELAAEIDTGALRVRLSKDKWAAEEAAINAWYAKQKAMLQDLAESGENVGSRSRQADVELQVRLNELAKARTAEAQREQATREAAAKQQLADEQRIAEVEKRAAIEANGLQTQLTKSKWAGERASADAAHQKELAYLNELAAKGEAIAERSRKADLEHEMRLRKLQQERLADLGGKMKGAGLGLTIGVTTPLAAVGGKGIADAMAAGETANKFAVAYKANTAAARAELEKFSQEVNGLNIVRLEEMSSQFQLLFNAMQISGNQATEMSTTLTRLAYDLSSLYNTSIEEAFTRLQSGMVGETEAIRRYGVDVSDVALKQEAMNRGLNKNVENMSQSEKIMLRYSMIMKQTADAQGDLARTQDSDANKSRLLAERYAAVSVELGQKLMPLYIKAIDVANSLIDRWNGMSESGKTFTVYLGLAAAAAGPLLSAAGNLITLYATLAARSAAYTAAKAAETAAIAANTEATAANTAAQVASGGRFAAMGSSIAAVASSWAGMVAIGYIGAELLDLTMGKLVRAVTGWDNFNLSMTRALIEGKNAFDAWREARDKALDANAGTKQADEYVKRGDHSIRKDVEASYARQVAARSQSDKQATAAAHQLAEEAQKTVAENDRANKAARQDLWILRQLDETAKTEASAWVEFTRERDKVCDAQRQAYEKYGVALDVTDQITTLQAQYKAKVEEAVDQQKQTALDQKAANAAAQIEFQALQTQDQYESDRLQVQANLVRTLNSLEREKASELEKRIAIAQAQKQINEVNRRQAEEMQQAYIDDKIAMAKAEALRSGDEKRINAVNAAATAFQGYWNALNQKAQGKPWKGAYQYADAEYADTQKKDAEKAAETAKQKAKEAAEQAQLERTAALEVSAMQAEDRGETKVAAHDRALIQLIQDTADFNALREKGINITERANLAQEKYLRNITKAASESATQEANAVMARITALRQEQQERERAYNDEMRRRRDSVQFTSAEEYSRQAILSGLTTRFTPIPVARDTATPPDSKEVATAVASLRQEQIQTNRRLENLIDEVKRLGGVPTRLLR